MPIYMKIEGVRGDRHDYEADHFDFVPQLTSEPTAPEAYLSDLLISHVTSVDPTNPNVDLLETPGPDGNLGLLAVQTDDGLPY